MNSLGSENQRVLSGMRPTGRMHLGHLHGVLKNWLKLQHEYECFFFVADWHALTTNYEQSRDIEASMWEMLVDWLAVGVDPGRARIFIQSQIPEHAELHLLLSMVTPLGWLERVPTYKEQLEQITEKDLATYGFLGYPVLQAADILMYKAGWVPVGEDQVPHVELTREIARRFNFMFGREPGFESKVEAAIKKLGKRNAKLYRELRKQYQEQGDQAALQTARALIAGNQNLPLGDRDRLLGSLEGTGRTILAEPQPLLTEAARMPGLDGRKMSKSYGNTIGLRDDPEEIEQKLRTMPTDPARARRSDPGNPEKCPVWEFHKIYSDQKTRDWVWKGCTTAGIGCLECKQPVIESVLKELKPIRERAAEIEANSDMLRNVVSQGCDAAREVAHDTMDEVRQAMGLKYR
ncbi:MAG: tryptophan--tRNA ligase [Gammaproteobacteria bacterium]|nr:tryptophan--tRNA ligase [Gammaproteobacteria bacterium]MBU6508669.1 tryptophan--tRNA ligase [Gammaproteobacteria bacterium]MDE1982976.1 tryptophan--tRNA ligase [Gammaproteobacteria bacterium]MDE2109099.1 tryptophan--tRNA ligase [Gammaproteobacteria bacterium]MDE2459710.1 tryptophan--tRNA ligase [Gammaproteobacteria bacterium]